MNNFNFEDMVVGLAVSFEVVITKTMLDTFITLSGDNSLLHTDEAFARQKGFAGIPVHGMLTGAFYSQLVGIYLPGENGYSQEYTISFTAPVYIGDVLTVKGEIEYINEAAQQVLIQAQMTNGNGVKVSRAKIKAGFLKRA